MKDFLGYHNADDRGPYFPDEKSRRSKTGTFNTGKGFKSETLIGSRVWVVEGRGTPRQYRLVSRGTITNVTPKNRVADSDDDRSIEFKVDEFNDPIDVTNYEWFVRLRDSLQNFRFGFSSLTDSKLIREIENSWSDRGTYASIPVFEDINNIQMDNTLDSTTKKRLIDARLGQGKFRYDLELRWEGACAVTGCKVLSILRASHIKAWKDSTNSERLDQSNGLLLVADLDALFDCGLITFRDDGRMLVSKQIASRDKRLLQLGRSLSKRLTNNEKRFIRYHREAVFQDRSSK